MTKVQLYSFSVVRNFMSSAGRPNGLRWRGGAICAIVALLRTGACGSTSGMRLYMFKVLSQNVSLCSQPFALAKTYKILSPCATLSPYTLQKRERHVSELAVYTHTHTHTHKHTHKHRHTDTQTQIDTQTDTDTRRHTHTHTTTHTNTQMHAHADTQTHVFTQQPGVDGPESSFPKPGQEIDNHIHANVHFDARKSSSFSLISKQQAYDDSSTMVASYADRSYLKFLSAEDVVHVGPFRVRSRFGVIEHSESLEFRRCDGILGMGYSDLARSACFFRTLTSAARPSWNIIQPPSAVILQRRQFSFVANEYLGELQLGGHDPESVTEPLFYMKMLNESGYGVAVSSMTYNGKQILDFAPAYRGVALLSILDTGLYTCLWAWLCSVPSIWEMCVWRSRMQLPTFPSLVLPPRLHFLLAIPHYTSFPLSPSFRPRFDPSLRPRTFFCLARRPPSSPPPSPSFPVAIS